jgi:hypothetical protein
MEYLLHLLQTSGGAGWPRQFFYTKNESWCYPGQYNHIQAEEHPVQVHEASALGL